MSDIQRTFVAGLLASATCRTLPTGFYVDMKKGFPWFGELNKIWIVSLCILVILRW